MGGYAQSVGGNTHGAITNRGIITFNDRGEGKKGASPMSLTGNVSNAGTLELDTGDGTVGKTFQVQGDWFGGAGSLISLTAMLAGDDSNIDKVDITGAATGTTRVKVRNVGGAGGYVYSLNSKENSEKKANGIWYLTSVKQASPDSDDIRNHNVSPLFGAYASNLLAVNTLFNTSLSDRESGESVDPVTGARGQVWARVAGGTTRGMMFDGANRFSGSRLCHRRGVLHPWRWPRTPLQRAAASASHVRRRQGQDFRAAGRGPDRGQR